MILKRLAERSLQTLSRYRKLRKMSADEIRVRLASAVSRRRERRRYRSAAGSTRHGKTRPMAGDAGGMRAAAAALLPGTRSESLRRVEREFPEIYTALASRARATAAAVLSGSWVLLGHPVDLRGSVDWHRDPRSGEPWPRIFYADVSLRRADEAVDVKYVWELGRQQYLVELARGWLLTGDERYSTRARALMLDWIEQNPVYEGVHWTSGLEVAMRAISWIWTVATLAEWDGWRPTDLDRVAASLADHATYLEHHFSLYSSPYNHLVGEATGLYLAGCVLRGHAYAERWRTRGRDILLEHGPRQFYADGFCVEQATGYHFYVLGFLVQAVAAARAEGQPLEKLEPVVQRAFRTGALFRQPDGRWPPIGDVDSARSIPVHPEDFWDFSSLCGIGAALFSDATLKLDAEPGEELYWLLGCDGLERWSPLPRGELPASAVLAESGYVIARRGRDWLLFDAGPIAHGVHADATPSTAHGHADTLQVLYASDGVPLLVDSGTPSYSGAHDWVRHFRSAAAHNTLEIEGVCFARDAGRLAWSHAAARPHLTADLASDVWLACGRVDWPGHASADRRLLGIPGRGLWIIDRVQSTRRRRCRWFWQFAVEIAALDIADDELTSVRTCDESTGSVVLAAWSESAMLALRHHAADDRSPAAWHSPGYGITRPAKRVVAETSAEGVLVVVTYLGHWPLSSRPAGTTGHMSAEGLWDIVDRCTAARPRGTVRLVRPSSRPDAPHVSPFS